ncbi:MAG: helix-turn-helix transcriptional regulator [Candidatus Tritonobacter lacicola]|nr:helix-turn-helix transcriptional regulator [Candidatus Tritonobacter lacicola]
MKSDIAKYFWSMSDNALEETGKIIREPSHPYFRDRAITLLSRCDEPDELFEIIPKETFRQEWPAIKRAWRKKGVGLDYLSWWDAIYANLIRAGAAGGKRLASSSRSEYMRFIGEQIKKARLSRGWTQKELADRIGAAQRNISAMETGKSNMTMATFVKVARALGIEKIDLNFSRSP